jgi:hypothetical protein
MVAVTTTISLNMMSELSCYLFPSKVEIRSVDPHLRGYLGLRDKCVGLALLRLHWGVELRLSTAT